jgi:hypothetical protein
MTTLLQPSYLKYAYTLFIGKRREKLDFVLEPLQAMLQLSLLGFCPIGSKLTIQDNLLYIQPPSVGQGIIRFFNDDAKEDLYFLFNVFRRFVIYYKFLHNNPKHKELFDLLIEMCKEGLNKLMLTYTNSDKINIIHTLQLYKIMLEKPELCATNDVGIPSASAFDKAGLGTNSNIDDIFSKIVNIYSVEEFSIIHNVLLLIKKRSRDEDNSKYIDGLNQLLSPTNTKIKQWINDNISL